MEKGIEIDKMKRDGRKGKGWTVGEWKRKRKGKKRHKKGLVRMEEEKEEEKKRERETSLFV